MSFLQSMTTTCSPLRNSTPRSNTTNPAHRSPSAIGAIRRCMRHTWLWAQRGSWRKPNIPVCAGTPDWQQVKSPAFQQEPDWDRNLLPRLPADRADPDLAVAGEAVFEVVLRSWHSPT